MVDVGTAEDAHINHLRDDTNFTLLGVASAITIGRGVYITPSPFVLVIELSIGEANFRALSLPESGLETIAATGQEDVNRLEWLLAIKL